MPLLSKLREGRTYYSPILGLLLSLSFFGQNISNPLPSSLPKKNCPMPMIIAKLEPVTLISVPGGGVGGGQGSGSPKVLRREKRGREAGEIGKIRNIGTIFRNRKSTRRREPLWKGAGTGSAGCGMFRPPTIS